MGFPAQQQQLRQALLPTKQQKKTKTKQEQDLPPPSQGTTPMASPCSRSLLGASAKTYKRAQISLALGRYAATQQQPTKKGNSKQSLITLDSTQHSGIHRSPSGHLSHTLKGT